VGKRAYLKRAGTQAVRKVGANLLGKGGSHSIMSFFSIGSILSAGSILSIGSAGSILGLGSAGYSPFREREEDEDS
jgi:hypothetical protein